jgi:hypothetical protein
MTTRTATSQITISFVRGRRAARWGSVCDFCARAFRHRVGRECVLEVNGKRVVGLVLPGLSRSRPPRFRLRAGQQTFSVDLALAPRLRLVAPGSARHAALRKGKQQ